MRSLVRPVPLADARQSDQPSSHSGFRLAVNSPETLRRLPDDGEPTTREAFEKHPT